MALTYRAIFQATDAAGAASFGETSPAWLMQKRLPSELPGSGAGVLPGGAIPVESGER